MRDNLSSIVRKVFMGSLSALMVMPNLKTPDGKTQEEELTVGESQDGGRGLRKVTPRLILKQTDNADEGLLTSHRSHRSHRSHSSHRSHYSSRPTRQPPRPPTQAPAQATYTLGSRVLQVGMVGPDVTELMLILVKLGNLDTADVNTEARFTEAIERAVRAFQAANDLTVDGRVGPVTALHLKRQNERP